MFSTIVVPLTIAVLGVNALIASKLALMLSGIVGLKYLFKKEEKPVRKIVLQEKKHDKWWKNLPKHEQIPLETLESSKYKNSQHSLEPYYDSYSSPENENHNFLHPSEPYQFLEAPKYKK